MQNAANPREIRKARQKERLEQERILEDLRLVLDTRHGRRFVWRVLSEAGVFRLSFVPGERERTEFNEGRRSTGLALMADVHALDPSLYVLMAKEAADDEKKQEPEPTNGKPVDEEEMTE